MVICQSFFQLVKSWVLKIEPIFHVFNKRIYYKNGVGYICGMRRYPIGQQYFKGIREEGSVYIDKTQHIYSLIQSGKYYFLSRPRRFGKSLLISTIKELFLGSKEIFQGLWIADKWDWEKKVPVIHLSFNSLEYQELGLLEALKKSLKQTGESFGIVLQDETVKGLFRELITKTAGEGKVVILIDEYDKPITDYLDELPQAEENRKICKNFYSVLKEEDSRIRFLLITGVSKFSKVSIFSDLNNLEDITMDRPANALVGITQHELELNFAEELTNMSQAKGKDQLLEQIKTWYNGYSWGGEETLYNPFSILCFMKQEIFRNFWFQTGTPSFLVRHMKNQREFILENNWLSEEGLGNFDIEHLVSIPLLFQTGYLTIKEYDPKSRAYRLGYPNKEVELSLKDALLSAYRNIYPGGDSVYLTYSLSEALKTKDMEKLILTLNALISTIPYEHWRSESESIFHIIVHLSFTLLGLDVRSEVHSAKGRCDVLVFTDNYIYALELKLNSTPQKALEQIIGQGYLAPYLLDKRDKVAVGISFSSESRKVGGYEMAEW